MGKRIWQYPEATGITNSDVILIDSPTKGSRSIKANEIGSVLINKTITERGTFDAADDNVDGYKKVTVDVPYTDVEVASGPIASWDDGEDLPLKSLTSFIEPQQDLHGYDSPWVGGAGKNKVDININTSQHSGIWTFPTPITQTVTVSAKKNNVVTSETVWLLDAVLQDNTHIYVGDAGYVNSFPYTITVDASNPITKINYRNYGLTSGSYDIQVELGSTATSYAPYSNICSISGWDEANVTRTGKNLFDRDSIRRGVYTKEDGTTQSGSATTNFSSQFIKVKPNTIYSITMFEESYENGSLFGIYYDEDKNGINQKANTQNLISNNSKTFTTPSNAHYIVFTGYRGSGTDIFTTANTMVCEGTPTSYEPYNGQTYTIDLDGTRYGGTLDVVSGELVVTDGYIASYNGETLPSTWISDRDVYAEGSTPTTGAEVCYKLVTPLTIQLTPTQVKSLVGENNIYSNTGDVDVEYQKIWVRPSA